MASISRTRALRSRCLGVTLSQTPPSLCPSRRAFLPLTCLTLPRAHVPLHAASLSCTPFHRQLCPHPYQPGLSLTIFVYFSNSLPWRSQATSPPSHALGMHGWATFSCFLSWCDILSTPGAVPACMKGSLSSRHFCCLMYVCRLMVKI